MRSSRGLLVCFLPASSQVFGFPPRFPEIWVERFCVASLFFGGFFAHRSLLPSPLCLPTGFVADTSLRPRLLPVTFVLTCVVGCWTFWCLCFPSLSRLPSTLVECVGVVREAKCLDTSVSDPHRGGVLFAGKRVHRAISVVVQTTASGMRSPSGARPVRVGWARECRGWGPFSWRAWPGGVFLPPPPPGGVLDLGKSLWFIVTSYRQSASEPTRI